VWGERKPSYWVIDAHGNGAAIAVNRLVAAGAAPSWTTTRIETNGFRYEAGSIVVPYLKTLETTIALIARDVGLRIDGAKGKLPLTLRSIGRARIALYKPWTESIDEGWTRWVLDQYGFTFTSLSDADMRGGNLRARFDAIILPSAASERLVSGYPANVVPAPYAGGLGEVGVEALRAFARSGGTLICLGQSSGLAIEMFELPVRDVTREAGDRVFVPGSVLRLDLDPSRPLAYGMPARTAAFFAFSAAFEPTAPATSSGRGSDPSASAGLETIAHYGSKDLLLSGWLEGEDVIAGRAAVVQAAIGTGRVILFGFPVQHRGQSQATFRLLFNAIFSASPQLPTK
jgi:hypothetical protein